MNSSELCKFIKDRLFYSVVSSENVTRPSISCPPSWTLNDTKLEMLVNSVITNFKIPMTVTRLAE